jgi:hypothetical protein
LIANSPPDDLRNVLARSRLRKGTPNSFSVMAGLVPAIHVLPQGEDVDARVRGHDENSEMQPMPLIPFGEYRPDVTDYDQAYTGAVLNALPRGDGYGPFPTFTACSAAIERLDTKTRGQSGIRVIGPIPSGTRPRSLSRRSEIGVEADIRGPAKRHS